MQVTKGTWRMHEQSVPRSLSSSPAQEPGNEARHETNPEHVRYRVYPGHAHYRVFNSLPTNDTF